MLDYSLDLDDRLKGKFILKMILQPFVENSVNHGIREKENGGTVRVSGELSGDYIRFVVQDDGVGISEEILEKLRQENLGRNEKSFGIRGTIERIRIFYNADIKYEIMSNVGAGTVIEIRVPVNYMEESRENYDSGNAC
jgi:two-component system sensor histidine kinase YesM